MGLFARLTGKELNITQVAEKFNLTTLPDAHKSGEWTQLAGIGDEHFSVDYKPCRVSCSDKKDGSSGLRNGFTLAVVNNKDGNDLASIIYREESPGYYSFGGITRNLTTAQETLALLGQRSERSAISKIVRAANAYRRRF